MSNSEPKQRVIPFLFSFAERLTPLPMAEQTIGAKKKTPSATQSDTRFTRVSSETTDDA